MFYDEMMYVIKITDDCFMKCPYCMVDEEFKKTKMTHETFKTILQKSIGFKKILFSFVGGEPMMNGMEWFKEAFKIADEFSEKYVTKVEYQIFTNGVLLNDEWFELFDKNKVSVIMSYDGAGVGPKGGKKSQKILKKYGNRFTAVNMVINSDNHNKLVEIFKEMESCDVKRVMNYVNIYEQSMYNEFADGIIELFDYINETNPKTKFMSYDDIKRVVKTNTLDRLANVICGKIMINNDYVIHTDGTIKAGLSQTKDEQFIYGNIHTVSHIIDAVFSENNMQHNRDYLKSLMYLSPELEDINLLTRGGGFFFDKPSIGIQLSKPNIQMLKFYQKLFTHMRENNVKNK